MIHNNYFSRKCVQYSHNVKMQLAAIKLTIDSQGVWGQREPYVPFILGYEKGIKHENKLCQKTSPPVVSTMTPIHKIG
jgi:hypothetical protein